MQIGELSSIAQTLVTWLISKWEFVASGLGAIGLILLACARTGSTHVLNKRLWRLVLGKQELKSPVLSNFLAERDDLMHIRSMTSLKRVPTAAAAERLVAWLKKFDVDVDLVAAAGHHFDLDEPGFTQRPPGIRAIMLLTLGSIVFLYGGIAVAGLGASTPPVVQVKASKIWYAVTDQQARQFQLRGDPAPAIESSSCDDKPTIARTTGYPDHDVQVMCDLIATDGGKAARHDAHLGQIALAAFSAAALLFAGTVLFRSMWRTSKANELYKLIERRKADGGTADGERAVAPAATEAQKENTDSSSKS
jgi:hypothetical protein